MRSHCAQRRGRGAAAGALVALLAGPLLAACNRVEPSPRPAAPRAVLLVTIDTLRADHVGAYGADFARTPTLDALAAGGVRFETTLTATPITLPSHASILTGVWPPRHGVRHNGLFELDDALPTLAERFRRAGYATGAVVGAVVLRERYGLGRGFDHYDDRVGTRKAGEAGFLERPASEVTDAALAWIGERGDEPFFLWVHYYDPHQEHRAPEAFRERLPERPYDAEIAYVDHELGRLLSGLEADGRRDATLVAVTSDHGESLGEHGEQTHGVFLYDAVLRVPWILQGPGVPDGRVVSGVTRVVDVAPTLLGLAGLPPLADADGADLSAELSADGPPVERWAYAESLLPELDFGWAPLFAVRTDRRLYVRAPRPELYDLASDPGQEDTAAAEAAASSDAARALDRRIDRVLASEREGARVDLADDERARLQALGYALPEGGVAATGIDPKDAIRHHPLWQRGARALAAGRYGEAESALLEFLRHAPDSARAHGMLAEVYLYTGRADRALEHADRSLELDPSAGYRYADRAEIHMVRGDPGAARADFERAAVLAPDDAWVQMGLQWIALRDGDLAAATRHARRALALAPDDPFVRLRVGMLWREAGAYRPAMESFADAVRLRPDFGLAQARLAVELARVGRVIEAKTHRERAGEWTWHPAVGTEMALAIAAGGDPESGRRFLAELAERHPEDARIARARRRLGPPTQQEEGS